MGGRVKSPGRVAPVKPVQHLDAPGMRLGPGREIVPRSVDLQQQTPVVAACVAIGRAIKAGGGGG